MRMLVSYAMEAAEEDYWRSYMAAMAYSAARPHYKEFPFDPYKPIRSMTHAETDTRTAEGIKDEILQMLRS